jgi:thermolysin
MNKSIIMNVFLYKLLVRGMTCAVIIAGFCFPTPLLALLPDKDEPLSDQPIIEKTLRKTAPDRERLMAAKRLGVKVSWHEQSGLPVSVKGRNLAGARENGATQGLKSFSVPMIEEKANAVLDKISGVFGIRKAKEEFDTRQVIHDQFNACHVRRPQMHAGLRVIGGELIVHFDQSGSAYEVNGHYVPNIRLSLDTDYAQEDAAEIALADFEQMKGTAGKICGEPEEVIFALERIPKLAYEVTVAGEDSSVRWRYWVDAQTGEILLKINDMKTIAAPTANGTHAAVSGNLLSGEGGSSVSITGWYENTGYYYLYNTNRRWYVYNRSSSGYADNSTYAYRNSNSWSSSDRAEISLARNIDLVQQYFRNNHNRYSFNNAGIFARANVHEGSQYVNAYWDGSDFHFGDGNGSTANSLAVLDVCGHEYAHGVTDYTADLYYYSESGALNESFSDIFGTLVEFYAQPDGRSVYPSKTAGQADWLCGEDCWLAATALRDLRSPRNWATVGSGVQPSRYHGTYWYYGFGDNAGVHYNSGPQNFLFYLLSEGGSGDNDGRSYNVTGIGISNAAQVAYRTLTVYCSRYTDYSEARSAWMSAAADLNPAWVSSVSQAWDAIGVTVIPETTSTALGEAVNAPELTWKTWGSTGSYWYVDTATTHDGSQAGRSGHLGNSQLSYISTEITGPGTLSFYWRVSSEQGWDYLIFYIDGSTMDAISGESGWENMTCTISSGTHTCKWSYVKDMSVASGSDAAWLDEVVWTSSHNQPPSPPTLSSPANGATGIGLEPTLAASSYSDSDGNPHANTQWQVDNDSSFASPAWDSGEDYAAGTQTTVPAGKLANSTRYYWRARYKDNQNMWSGWATASSFTTVAGAGSPPAAPSGLTATDGSYADTVMVYWNSVATATGYKIWRSVDNHSQNASCLGTINALVYLDTSVIYGNMYYYWVQAINDSGESALSSADSGYCGVISSELAAPANVTASDGTFTEKILVTWNAVNNATQYEVWRNIENNRATAALIGKTTFSYYYDSSAAQGIYNYYWVRARNTSAYGNFSEQETGWRLLSSPAGFRASAGTYPYRIVLDWNPVINASGYEIWRAEIPGNNSAGSEAILLARLTDTYYNDYTASAGTVYRYAVRTYNTLCESAFTTDTGWREMAAAAEDSAAGNDFDGDRKADLALYNSSLGVYEVLCSTLGLQKFVFGARHGAGLAGHLDNDLTADPVVYCADTGTWLAIMSSVGYGFFMQTKLECNGSALLADFDGDGLADLGVYLPAVPSADPTEEATGVFSVLLSNRGAFDIHASVSLGGGDYYAVPYDFDGDAKADPAVYSEAEGLVTAMFSGAGYEAATVAFGGPGKKMYAGDFDGDAMADPVFYEETTGLWDIKLSSADYAASHMTFGGPGYIPAIDDYDGDGYSDPAIYQESSGTWQIMYSAGGYALVAETFGGPNFIPVRH